MNIKTFMSIVVQHCRNNDYSLQTRDVIDVAIRDFPTSIKLCEFDNHDLYYASRWYISKLRDGRLL